MKNNKGGNIYMNRFTKGAGLVAKVMLVGSSVALLGASCWQGVGTNTNVGVETNTNTVATNTLNENTNSSTEIDTSDWLTYTNEEYGFSFRYPETLPLAVDQEGGSTFLDFDFFFIRIVANTENISLDRWVNKHVNINKKLELESTQTTEGVTMVNVVKSFELEDFGEYPGTQTYFSDPANRNIFLVGYLQDKTILRGYGYDDSILEQIINSLGFVD